MSRDPDGPPSPARGQPLSTFIVRRPYHVTVTKNTKGYSWEVSFDGDDMDKVMDDVMIAEADLKKRYGGTE